MFKTTMICLIVCISFACQSPTNNQQGNKIGQLDTIAMVKDANSDSTSPLEKPANGDALITAGKGIGHILLGNDANEVINKLGKPDFEDAAMGKTLMTWYAKHDTAGYQTSIFSSRNMGGKNENKSIIKKIFVSSPWFKTSEKVGIGSTMAEISKNYNIKSVPSYAANKESIKIYTDTDKGISFEINGKNSKCVGIIVHKPHEDVGTYLNMHDK